MNEIERIKRQLHQLGLQTQANHRMLIALQACFTGLHAAMPDPIQAAQRVTGELHGAANMFAEDGDPETAQFLTHFAAQFVEQHLESESDTSGGEPG